MFERSQPFSRRLVFLFALLPYSVTADQGKTPLPFRLHDDGGVLVPVSIDGHGPFLVVLDTGSSRSAISAEIASQLGIKSLGRTLMVTPTGRGVRAMGQVQRLALGSAPPVSAQPMIVPRRDLNRDMSIDGLLGQDVLAGLTYTIDYVKRRIVFDSPAAAERSGVRLPLEMSAGRLLVTLSDPTRTSRPLQFIPDSGADGFVLFERPGQVLPPLTPLDTAALRAVSGQQVVRRVLIDQLKIGDITLRDQVGVLVDRGEIDAALGDGLLPLHVFARVTFNGPERYLIVEAR